MDFIEYFSQRNELMMRVLIEVPEVTVTRSDDRLIGIGTACLGTAIAVEIWASLTLNDPGYFSRTSTFLQLLLLAGFSVLVAGKFAEVGLAKLRVKTREALKERTVRRLISADRVIASKLAERER